jgi:predicted metal-dependent peptidase
MGYNLDFMAKHPHEQIIGVFVHECLHVILKHHLREAECKDFQEKHTKYNYACDYALNPIIKHSKGMDISPSWLYKSKWDDSLADEIFYQLKDEECDGKCTGDRMPGEVRPFPGNAKKGAGAGGGKPTPAEVDAEKQKIDQWVRAAQFKAQGAGKLPGSVKELVKSATAPTVSWQDELIFLCEEVTKNNYTWTRPNQRYMQFGVYLPSMNGRKSVDMIFFVDTSGSLSEKQLEQICAEVQIIVQSFMVRCIVVYWDTKYQGMEVFEPSDVLEPEWGLDTAGHGGTDFEDCFDWMEENMYDFDFDPKAMVFFSDLECSSYISRRLSA